MGSKPSIFLAVFLREFLEEGHGEEGDVVPALAQGRDVDVHDVEPVVEILAESSLGYLLLEVAVGGGHDAHVGLYGLLPAHALEFPVLEDAQDLYLHVLVDFAYLVQKEGALVRELETPPRPRLGPREGAFLVAEELALEETLRQGRAVDLDEGAALARREVVYRVGYELLAYARLAGDEDARLGRRHAADEVEYLLHLRARAHHAARLALGLHLGLELAVLEREFAALEGALHEEGEVVYVDGLGEEIEGAEAHGLDRVLDGAVPGEYDDGEPRITSSDGAEEFLAREPGHLEVGDDQVHLARLHGPEPLGAVGRGLHGVAVETQGLGEAFPNILLVVDDEDAKSHNASPCSFPVRPGEEMMLPLRHGKADREGRALADPGVDRDLALMLLHDLEGDCEAKPRSRVLCGEIGLEYLREVLLGNTDSRVGDRDLDFLLVSLDREAEAAPLGHSRKRVLGEVQEGLLQVALVDEDAGNGIVYLEVELHALSLGLEAKEIGDLLYYLARSPSLSSTSMGRTAKRKSTTILLSLSISSITILRW